MSNGYKIQASNAVAMYRDMYPHLKDKERYPDSDVYDLFVHENQDKFQLGDLPPNPYGKINQLNQDKTPMRDPYQIDLEPQGVSSLVSAHLADAFTETGWGPVASPEFFKKSYNESMAGIAYYIANGRWKYDPKSYDDIGLGAEVGGFFMSLLSPIDLIGFFGLGGLGQIAATKGSQKLLLKFGMKGLQESGEFFAKRGLGKWGEAQYRHIAKRSIGAGGYLGAYSTFAGGMGSAQLQMDEMAKEQGLTPEETVAKADELRGNIDYWRLFGDAAIAGTEGVLLGGVTGATAAGINLGFTNKVLNAAEKGVWQGRAADVGVQTLALGAEALEFTTIPYLIHGGPENADAFMHDLMHNVGVIGAFKTYGVFSKRFKSVLQEAMEAEYNQFNDEYKVKTGRNDADFAKDISDLGNPLISKEARNIMGKFNESMGDKHASLIELNKMIDTADVLDKKYDDAAVKIEKLEGEIKGHAVGTKARTEKLKKVRQLKKERNSMTKELKKTKIESTFMMIGYYHKLIKNKKFRETSGYTEKEARDLIPLWEAEKGGLLRMVAEWNEKFSPINLDNIRKGIQFKVIPAKDSKTGKKVWEFVVEDKNGHVLDKKYYDDAIVAEEARRREEAEHNRKIKKAEETDKSNAALQSVDEQLIELDKKVKALEEKDIKDGVPASPSRHKELVIIAKQQMALSGSSIGGVSPEMTKTFLTKNANKKYRLSVKEYEDLQKQGRDMVQYYQHISELQRAENIIDKVLLPGEKLTWFSKDMTEEARNEIVARITSQKNGDKKLRQLEDTEKLYEVHKAQAERIRFGSDDYNKLIDEGNFHEVSDQGISEYLSDLLKQNKISNKVYIKLNKKIESQLKKHKKISQKTRNELERESNSAEETTRSNKTVDELVEKIALDKKGVEAEILKVVDREKKKLESQKDRTKDMSRRMDIAKDIKALEEIPVIMESLRKKIASNSFKLGPSSKVSSERAFWEISEWIPVLQSEGKVTSGIQSAVNSLLKLSQITTESGRSLYEMTVRDFGEIMDALGSKGPKSDITHFMRGNKSKFKNWIDLEPYVEGVKWTETKRAKEKGTRIGTLQGIFKALMPAKVAKDEKGKKWLFFTQGKKKVAEFLRPRKTPITSSTEKAAKDLLDYVKRTIGIDVDKVEESRTGAFWKRTIDENGKIEYSEIRTNDINTLIKYYWPGRTSYDFRKILLQFSEIYYADKITKEGVNNYKDAVDRLALSHVKGDVSRVGVEHYLGHADWSRLLPFYEKVIKDFGEYVLKTENKDAMIEKLEKNGKWNEVFENIQPKGQGMFIVEFKEGLDKMNNAFIGTRKRNGKTETFKTGARIKGTLKGLEKGLGDEVKTKIVNDMIIFETASGEIGFHKDTLKAWIMFGTEQSMRPEELFFPREESSFKQERAGIKEYKDTIQREKITSRISDPHGRYDHMPSSNPAERRVLSALVNVLSDKFPGLKDFVQYKKNESYSGKIFKNVIELVLGNANEKTLWHELGHGFETFIRSTGDTKLIELWDKGQKMSGQWGKNNDDKWDGYVSKYGERAANEYHTDRIGDWANKRQMNTGLRNRITQWSKLFVSRLKNFLGIENAQDVQRILGEKLYKGFDLKIAMENIGEARFQGQDTKAIIKTAHDSFVTFLEGAGRKFKEGETTLKLIHKIAKFAGIEKAESFKFAEKYFKDNPETAVRNFEKFTNFLKNIPVEKFIKEGKKFNEIIEWGNQYKIANSNNIKAGLSSSEASNLLKDIFQIKTGTFFDADVKTLKEYTRFVRRIKKKEIDAYNENTPNWINQAIATNQLNWRQAGLLTRMIDLGYSNMPVYMVAERLGFKDLSSKLIGHDGLEAEYFAKFFYNVNEKAEKLLGKKWTGTVLKTGLKDYFYLLNDNIRLDKIKEKTLKDSEIKFINSVLVDGNKTGIDNITKYTIDKNGNYFYSDKTKMSKELGKTLEVVDAIKEYNKFVRNEIETIIRFKMSPLEFEAFMKDSGVKWLSEKELYVPQVLKKSFTDNFNVKHPKIEKEIKEKVEEKIIKWMSENYTKKQLEKMSTKERIEIEENQRKIFVDDAHTEIKQGYDRTPDKYGANFLKSRKFFLGSEFVDESGKRIQVYETTWEGIWGSYSAGVSKFMANMEYFPEYLTKGTIPGFKTKGFSADLEAYIVKKSGGKRGERWVRWMDEQVQRTLGIGSDATWDFSGGGIRMYADMLSKLQLALPTSGIKNIMMGMSGTLGYAGPKYFAKAVIASFNAQNRRDMYQAGTPLLGLKRIFIAEAYAQNIVHKLLTKGFKFGGMELSEKINRIISPLAGQMYISDKISILSAPGANRQSKKWQNTYVEVKRKTRLTDKQMEQLIKYGFDGNTDGHKFKSAHERLKTARELELAKQHVLTASHVFTQGASTPTFMPAFASKDWVKPWTLYKRMAYAATVNTVENTKNAVLDGNWGFMLASTLSHAFNGQMLLGLNDMLFGVTPPKSKNPWWDRFFVAMWRGEFMGLLSEFLNPYGYNRDSVMGRMLLPAIAGTSINLVNNFKDAYGGTRDWIGVGDKSFLDQSLRDLSAQYNGLMKVVERKANPMLGTQKKYRQLAKEFHDRLYPDEPWSEYEGTVRGKYRKDIVSGIYQGSKEDFARILQNNIFAITIDYYREGRDGAGKELNVDPKYRWKEAYALAIKEINDMLYEANPGRYIEYKTAAGNLKSSAKEIRGFRNSLTKEEFYQIDKQKKMYEARLRMYMKHFKSYIDKDNGFKNQTKQAVKDAVEKYGAKMFW